MSAELIPAILILAVVIIIAIALKKVATSCYKETGVNILSSLNKFLWYAEIAAAVLLAEVRHADTAAKAIPILVMCIIVFVVIQMLLSMKAGMKYAIISGLLHGIGGIILGVFNICVFLFKIFFHIPGGLFSVNTSAIDEINAQATARAAQQQAEAARAQQIKDEQADGYAQRLGFRDADDAERAGFNTGKYQE